MKVCIVATGSCSYFDLLPTDDSGIAERFNDHVLLELERGENSDLQRVLRNASESEISITLTVMSGERTIHAIDHDIDPLQATLWRRLLHSWAVGDQSQIDLVLLEGIGVLN